jgi:glycosyltransferase involved in cell wall biosynthesis
MTRDEVAAAMMDCLRDELLAGASGEGAAPEGRREAAQRRFELFCELLGAEACDKLGLFAPPPADFLLSVVIPVYNEAATIEQVIARVRSVDLPMEIILVDDGSRDGTREILDRLRSEPDLRIVFHDANQGKGAAVRTVFDHATGDVVVIQDADLEYDPQEFVRLLAPILDNRADVVYGSRFSNTDRPMSRYWHQLANRIITVCSNMRTNLPLSDVETCYKMIRREMLVQVTPSLREKRFGIEIELTAKLARIPGIRFFERPIRYAGRTWAQGKKIGWRDGLSALWCILKY